MQTKMNVEKVFLPFMVLFFIVIGCTENEKSDTPITVATYNLPIVNNNPEEINAWPNRIGTIKGMVCFHEFDIFGVQETFINQLQDLCEIEGFAYTGHGRDDGIDMGEHVAILYKTDRFDLLDSGDFWLSETPNKPSLGWDATCCNRISSWGKFKDVKTNKEFFFFNVHFDHEGTRARIESAKLMVEKIQEIAQGEPVICVGDFNSLPETEQIKTMQTFLKNSRLVSATPPYGPKGTWNAFDFNSPLDRLIDYIFVSSTIDVLKYGVLTDNVDCKYPSDHLPVVTKVVIN